MYIGSVQSLIILAISLSVNYWLFGFMKSNSRIPRIIGTVIFGLGWWLIALLLLGSTPT